jgi:Protein of unknown function (DUF998)
MIKENVFSWQVRFYGLLGLLGLVAFLIALIILHLNLANTNIDWMRYYVSYLANEPLGKVFVVGTLVHGLGNLALTLGMRGALPPGRLRDWGVLLFGLAAVGVLLAALFSIDPPGEALSTAGRIHRTAASATFSLELAALFVFSTAFGRHHYWRRQRVVSRVFSISAAVALSMFVIALQLDVVPGLAERVALTVFLTWEFWVAVQLAWKH